MIKKVLSLYLNKAFISRENNYCCPQIATYEKDSHAFVKATQLRHPLIEHIQTNELYVTNDIELDQEGILLTGYNGIGKTSLKIYYIWYNRVIFSQKRF